MANVKIAESSRIIGSVSLGEGTYIAQGTILRSHDESLTIGGNSMVLENSVLIGTANNPLNVGSKTVFGHKCMAIGATIGDLCEIGNGVIMLPGSRIGDMCIFGEGTLIEENVVIPDGSVVVGKPGKIIRRITENDKSMIKRMRGNDISLPDTKKTLIDNSSKEVDKVGKLYPYKDKYPQISESATLYDSAEITGDVIIGDNTTIGAGVKIIGDSHGPIRIGNNVQILENSVLHLLPDNELIINDNVIIGPNCMIHGTNIGENSVIESASIVCDYSTLGKNTLVRTGTLVKQRSSFPDNIILEGYIAKEVGKVDGTLEKPDWAIRE